MTERPSFTQFWRRTEEALVKKLTFVQSHPGQQSKVDADKSEDAERTADDKAQIRRAQVRRAQIQHRQRKAAYMKRLEDEVAGMLASVDNAKRERQTLEDENEALRAQLAGNRLGTVPEIRVSSFPPYSLGPQPDNTVSCGMDLNLDESAMDFHLEDFDIMSDPAFYIPDSSAGLHDPFPWGIPEDPNLYPSMPDGSSGSLQQVMNFIQT